MKDSCETVFQVLLLIFQSKFRGKKTTLFFPSFKKEKKKKDIGIKIIAIAIHTGLAKKKKKAEDYLFSNFWIKAVLLIWG